MFVLQRDTVGMEAVRAAGIRCLKCFIFASERKTDRDKSPVHKSQALSFEVLNFAEPSYQALAVSTHCASKSKSQGDLSLCWWVRVDRRLVGFSVRQSSGEMSQKSGAKVTPRLKIHAHLLCVTRVIRAHQLALASVRCASRARHYFPEEHI